MPEKKCWGLQDTKIGQIDEVLWFETEPTFHDFGYDVPDPIWEEFHRIVELKNPVHVHWDPIYERVVCVHRSYGKT